MKAEKDLIEVMEEISTKIVDAVLNQEDQEDQGAVKQGFFTKYNGKLIHIEFKVRDIK